MNDTTLFDFESDFVSTLRCVPMAVRFKLDRVEIKLSLRQWSRFTRDDRQALLLRACETPDEVEAYRQILIDLIALRAGEAAKPLPPQPPPAWAQSRRTPVAVIGHARENHVPAPTDADWRGLNELQRFVLVKLSRDNHDNINFLPALAEFGLLRLLAA